MAIEIVDFSMKHGDVPCFFVNVYRFSGNPAIVLQRDVSNHHSWLQEETWLDLVEAMRQIFGGCPKTQGF